MAKLIVMRDSPDWLHFDLKDSRDFCRRNGIPETTIEDFAHIWDRTLKIDYRSFRASMKEIAVSTFFRVRGSCLMSSVEIRTVTLTPDDTIVFTDDDDWYSPDLFDVPRNHHGARWGSIRLGRVFSLDAQLTEVLTFRCIDNTIYTNNYLVSGGILTDLGFTSLFEQRDAQKAQDGGLYVPLANYVYLSCANKTPASALSARFLMSKPDFLSDPRAEFSQFADRLTAAGSQIRDEWMRQPLDRYIAVMNEAVYG